MFLILIIGVEKYNVSHVPSGTFKKSVSENSTCQKSITLKLVYIFVPESTPFRRIYITALPRQLSLNIKNVWEDTPIPSSEKFFTCWISNNQNYL